jgi:hypothetical protein
MTKTITVPTADKLARHLSHVDALMTAKRWERAAIVYAFTTDESVGGRPSTKNPSASEQVHFPVPISAFVKLGYAGLTSRTTVGRYRRAWVQAIEEGFAQPTEPGQPVELPDETEHAWEDFKPAPVEPVAPAALSVVPDPAPEPEDEDEPEYGTSDVPPGDWDPREQDPDAYPEFQPEPAPAPEPEPEDVEPREPRKVPQGARPQARIELTRVDDVDYVAAKIVEIGQDYGTMPLNTWLRRVAAQLTAQADVVGRGDVEPDAATA